MSQEVRIRHLGLKPAWPAAGKCGVPQFQHQLQGHPARARQARGGRRGAAQRRAGRARGPLWRGPSLGAPGFSHRATIRKARIGELCDIALAHNFPLENKLEAPPCASLRPEPSRRRPLEGPPRGQGRRATGRPSPPWSRKRAAPPDQHRVPLIHPSPTSSSSRVNVRPLRRSQRHLRRPRRRPDGDEVNRGSPRW